MPVAAASRFTARYEGQLVQTVQTTGPSAVDYNFALSPTEKSRTSISVVDVVASATAGALSGLIPSPDKGSLKVKSKRDRLNTLEWTPTSATDTFDVYWSPHMLANPDNATDTRNPDTACGAMLAMTKLNSEPLRSTDGTSPMTFDIDGVMGVQTATVVVTRPSGYSETYARLYLTVEGGKNFAPVVPRSGSSGDPQPAQPIPGPSSGAALALSGALVAVVALAHQAF